MDIYLAIKYYPNGENRALIEQLCGLLETAGHGVTCVVRDVEAWGANEFSPSELMHRSFQALEMADFVLLEFSEKGVGLGIEAGYAHAQGIPVVVVARQGSDISTTLQGIAQQVYFYQEPSEIATLVLPAPRTDHGPGAWPYAARSIARLLDCLDGLSTEQLNQRPYAMGNSLYVLATHIIGNVEETVWGIICGGTVHRNREAEFHALGIDTIALRTHWTELRSNIDRALGTMVAADLARPRQHPRRGPMSAYDILIVIARHAAEHLAQAELTRDLLLSPHLKLTTIDADGE